MERLSIDPQLKRTHSGYWDQDIGIKKKSLSGYRNKDIGIKNSHSEYWDQDIGTKSNHSGYWDQHIVIKKIPIVDIEIKTSLLKKYPAQVCFLSRSGMDVNISIFLKIILKFSILLIHISK